MVLTALRLHQNFLHMVALQQANPATLCVLSTFTTLASRFLHLPSSQDISLQAFAGLPSLHALRLDTGRFSDVNAAAHLTSLVLLDRVEASCSEDCSCVTSLLGLIVRHSQLGRFHSQGVSACSNLQHLSCSYGLVSAINPDEDLRWDNTRTSAGPSLTALLALTSLILCHTDASLNLEWVTVLKTLQDLHACLGNTELPAAFSSMRHLTSLLVGLLRYLSPHVVVKLTFDWSKLVPLKHVVCYGPVRVSRLHPIG